MVICLAIIFITIFLVDCFKRKDVPVKPAQVVNISLNNLFKKEEVRSFTLITSNPGNISYYRQSREVVARERDYEKDKIKEMAREMVGDEQFECLDKLLTRESNWDSSAQNPTSSAYGIFQFLNSTWAGTGIDKTDDPERQLEAGLIYINRRYGNSCGAWQQSLNSGWY
jgi:hypothetical protein